MKDIFSSTLSKQQLHNLQYYIIYADEIKHILETLSKNYYIKKIYNDDLVQTFLDSGSILYNMFHLELLKYDHPLAIFTHTSDTKYVWIWFDCNGKIIRKGNYKYNDITVCDLDLPRPCIHSNDINTGIINAY